MIPESEYSAVFIGAMPSTAQDDMGKVLCDWFNLFDEALINASSHDEADRLMEKYVDSHKPSHVPITEPVYTPNRFKR